MPSKKKARSLARKAKKETKQAADISNRHSGSAAPDTSSCTHIKVPDNCTWDDFIEARALFEDFFANIVAYNRSNDWAMRGIFCHGMALSLANFERYTLLDDMNKDLFRQLVVSRGSDYPCWA
jgi:hypothetical protein